MHHDPGLHALQVILQPLDERQEVGVEQDRGRPGVDDRVGDVVGHEADVHRLQDRAHHGNCEIAFVIAVAVPFEHGDDVALLDADLREAAGEPADAFSKGAEGPAPQIAKDDLLIGRARHRAVQKVLDQQRIDIGRGRRGQNLNGHDASSLGFPAFCSLKMS